MAWNEDRRSLRLPLALMRQLGAFEKRLLAVETLLALFGGAGGVLLTYSLLFLADRFWDTPAGIRFVLSAAGGVGVAWGLVWWLRRWWWKRRDVRSLARLIRQWRPGMGGRLLGVVELATGDGVPANASPGLCRAAIAQVASEVAGQNLGETVPARRCRRWGAWAAALGILVALAALAAPQAARNALSRWARPLSPVQRYTFVRMEDLPDEQVVPHGEEFEIACRLSPFSAWRPRTATCRFEDQPEIRASVSMNEVVFRVPGQTSPGRLTLRLGDALKEMTITPVLRPELVRLTATVRLPEYLGYPEQAVDIRNPSAEFLRGSRVRFAGHVSRDVESARAVRAIREEGDSRLATAERLDLKVDGVAFETPEWAPEDTESCRFQWTDALGLSCAAPRVLKVDVVEDEAPLVDFVSLAPAVAILDSEILETKVRAEDDHGLQELWVNWVTERGKDDERAVLRGTEVLQKGAADRRELESAFSFSPLLLHIPEETLVTLSASALDFVPGRKPSVSLLRRVYVLSRLRHAKLVEEQVRVLQARLEDLTRQEENLLERNREIRKMNPAELATEKTGRRLSDHSLTESAQKQDLERIAKALEDLIQEALRNSDISEETLRRWAEMARAMQQTAGKEMQEAAQALRAAGADAGKRGEELDRAIAREEAALKALRKSERGVNRSIENMVAKSFVNRLLAAAGREREIQGTLKEVLPQIVGADPRNLPKEHAEKLDALGNRNDEVRREVRYVQDDLAGFYNRTRVAKYDAVQQEMVKAKATQRLAALTQIIRGNQGIQAIEQTGFWEKQLREWAEALREAAESSGEGQGEGGETDPQLADLIVALMRARRQEEGIRDQTRLLEEKRETTPTYSGDAAKLSDSQYELASKLRPLERRVKIPAVRGLLEKIGGEMMNAGMYLRKPQTDAATIAIETEIIELLSDSMQQSAGSSAGAMSAFGMMSGASRRGGGSKAGGLTDRPNERIAGDGSGEENPARDVDKGGGMDSSAWPEEFREALEGYFRSLESEK